MRQLLAAILLIQTSSVDCKITDDYDDEIRLAAALYFEGDWRLLKAQYYQESGLNPNAISPAGARGIAQFMPATWEEVASQLEFKSRTSSEVLFATIAGSYYMNQLCSYWQQTLGTKKWPMEFCQASYNAGKGNIIRAWIRCDKSKEWSIVGYKCLPSVTGNHAKETQTYIVRIRAIYQRLLSE